MIALRNRDYRMEGGDLLTILARPSTLVGTPDERIGVYFVPLNTDSTRAFFAYERGQWGRLFARDFRAGLSREIQVILETIPVDQMALLLARKSADTLHVPRPNKGYEFTGILDFFGAELGVGLGFSHFLTSRLGYVLELEREANNPDYITNPFTETLVRAGPALTLLRGHFRNGLGIKADLEAGLNYGYLRYEFPEEPFVDDQGPGAFGALYVKLLFANGLLVGIGFESETEIGLWHHEVKARVGYKF